MAEDLQLVALRKAANEVGRDFVAELGKQLVAADKVASGKLLRSLDYKVIDVLNNLMIRLVADPYLINVDKGRRAGAKQPPIAPIMKWIDIRKIKGRDKKTGRFISKKATAFIIARGIAKNGIAPTNVIAKAKQNIIAKKKEVLSKAALKDVQDAIHKILINI